MSKIQQGLYLGNWFDAQNYTMLTTRGISHVLCAAGELGACFPKQFTYKCVKASDHPSCNLSTYFDSVADFINQAMTKGSGILVHCAAGISRSTTCLIAYLMKYQGIPLDDALAICRRKRPIVCPNIGFMQQLRRYEAELQKRPSLRPVAASSIDNSRGMSSTSTMGKTGDSFMYSALKLQGNSLLEKQSKPKLEPIKPMIPTQAESVMLPYAAPIQPTSSTSKQKKRVGDLKTRGGASSSLRPPQRQFKQAPTMPLIVAHPFKPNLNVYRNQGRTATDNLYSRYKSIGKEPTLNKTLGFSRYGRFY